MAKKLRSEPVVSREFDEEMRNRPHYKSLKNYIRVVALGGGGLLGLFIANLIFFGGGDGDEPPIVRLAILIMQIGFYGVGLLILIVCGIVAYVKYSKLADEEKEFFQKDRKTKDFL